MTLAIHKYWQCMIYKEKSPSPQDAAIGILASPVFFTKMNMYTSHYKGCTDFTKQQNFVIQPNCDILQNSFYRQKIWFLLWMCFSILKSVNLWFIFSEFIEGVSQFSVKGDKESKLRCKFESKLRCKFQLIEGIFKIPSFLREIALGFKLPGAPWIPLWQFTAIILMLVLFTIGMSRLF